MLAKCPCQHCSNQIEFEVADFEESGNDFRSIYGQKVQCPHCGKETILCMEKPQSKEMARPGKPMKGNLPTAILLNLAGVVLFIIGCGLVASGCNGESLEESNPEGSAIRQTVFALQYGFGFVVIALSLILEAIIRLIRK